MTDENQYREAIRRLYAEFYNDARYELAEEFFHENAVYHEHSKDIYGRQGIANYVKGLFENVPDATNVLEKVTVDGDRVTTNSVITGTDIHGEPVRIEAIATYRFSNGKIIEKRDI